MTAKNTWENNTHLAVERAIARAKAQRKWNIAILPPHAVEDRQRNCGSVEGHAKRATSGTTAAPLRTEWDWFPCAGQGSSRYQARPAVARFGVPSATAAFYQRRSASPPKSRTEGNDRCGANFNHQSTDHLRQQAVGNRSDMKESVLNHRGSP